MNQHRLAVLLVEDNPGDARLVREMLRDARGASIELECADRLATGLERLRQSSVDVVLLDLSLPDAQGLDTFIRARSAAPDLPIVVLSGLDDESLAMCAVQEGAQDYLVKGHVDGNLLVRCMRYAVERKRAEAERNNLLLREQAARAQAETLATERDAILRQIADGVVIADPDGRITFVNAAARQLLGHEDLGLTVEEAIAGLNLLTLDGKPYPPEDVALCRAVRKGETVIGSEARIRRPDGAEIVIRGSATPVVAENGVQLGAVLTLQDVTAHYDLERQKDEFLASISHDLRTPVAAIKASIGVVLANEPANTPEPLHRMLVNVDLAADRMAKLVDDLLELTRLQAGRVQLRPSRCDLRDLAARSIRAIEPLAQARSQRIGVEIPSHAIIALVDAERLERALVNLLSNAHKYGRDGGSICLSLELRGLEAIFSVADDGPGIPPNELGRIFDRFYRSDAATMLPNLGSGLGLPIARGLVELHGGRISVESRPGIGSTFRIVVPLGLAPSPDSRGSCTSEEAHP